MLNITSLDRFTSAKILSWEGMRAKIAELKASGKKVGLCHGGFDLLHPGQMIHFDSAKKLCDVLVVSITSDRFVSSRKGSGRPVFTDKLRAYSVACLEAVDYVVITDVEKGVPVIETLKPSYYIKGPDFIGKTTPGITSEREAITRMNGEMKYTNDPKLGTTEIIEYVKNELDRKEVLLIIDRDGTLIMNDDFPGKNNTWKEELQLNDDVISYISYLQTKYATTKMVASNQAGVARGYFDCARVEEINSHLGSLLKAKGIILDNWQYCPDVDSVYAELKKNELKLNLNYVKDKPKRKPNTDMVIDGLKALKREMSEFAHVVVIGDREEDKILADNLKVKFVDVKEKKYEEMKMQFS